MADHLQQQLLSAYQATLVAAGTAAAARVYLDSLDALAHAQLPAIVIDGERESIELIAVDTQGLQQRDFDFSVTALCASASGASAAARDLGKQIEAALLASVAVATANNKAKQLLLTGSEVTKEDGTEYAAYALRQNWRVQYITAAGVPDVPL